MEMVRPTDSETDWARGARPAALGRWGLILLLLESGTVLSWIRATFGIVGGAALVALAEAESRRGGNGGRS